MTDAREDLAHQHMELELAMARRTLAPQAAHLASVEQLEVMAMTLARPMLVPIRTFTFLNMTSGVD